MDKQPESPARVISVGVPPLSPGSALWAQFACAALVGEMTTISLHDKPQIWRPMQAENAAALADAMMAEHAKRFPCPACKAHGDLMRDLGMPEAVMTCDHSALQNTKVTNERTEKE